MTRHLRLPSIVVALLVVTLAPTRAAKTIAFDALTIPEINQAFDTGALTSETLVQLCLARIDAYDRQGPSLHAVLTINPKARETARALDAERKTKGPRSPLHGIPVVLKDNYNTFDMPTTGGSVLLEGSVPPADAFIVKKLRAAGARVSAGLSPNADALDPGFHGDRRPWIRGFMAFHRLRPASTAMLMVSVWPESGFLRWPCDYRQQSLLVSSVCVVQYIFRSRLPAVPGR